ncbi:MAG: hypothetical protein D6794_11020, partial [Deltaproteobacteria bacterium]
VDDIGRVISSPEQYGRDVRIFGLEILRRSTTKAHVEDIIQCILDENEDEVFKRYAIRALKDIAPESLSRIKPLLSLPEGKATSEVIGTALNALFPDHLTTEDIIRNLKRRGSAKTYGGFQVFVKRVATELAPDTRALVMDALAEELRTYLDAKKKRQEVPDWTKEFVPAYQFDDFLLEQLSSWRDSPEHFPKLKQWLDLLAESAEYGLITGSGLQNIADFLKQHHVLRRELCRLRIERLYAEKGDDFEPYMIHLHERLYLPQKEDLDYWKDVVLEWCDEAPSKLEAAWYELLKSWNQGEPSPELIDWLEDVSESHGGIRTLWERDRVCEIQEWQLDNAKHNADRQRQAIQEIEAIRANLHLIRQGHARWIIGLVSNRFGEDKDVFSWLRETVGDDA